MASCAIAFIICTRNRRPKYGGKVCIDNIDSTTVFAPAFVEVETSLSSEGCVATT